MATDQENTPRRRIFAGEELEMMMAEIEKGQQLAGHFPDAATMERTRQILTGEISYEEAMAGLHAEVLNWRRENPGGIAEG